MDPSLNRAYSYAEYILEGHTVEDTSKKFTTSRKTILKYLSFLTDKDSLYYDENLAKKILLMRAKMTLNARIESGRKSKRKEVLDNDAIEYSIYKILIKGTSLRELAAIFSCSHTSIVNGIKRISSPELLNLIEKVMQMRKKKREFSKEDIENYVLSKLANGSEEFQEIYAKITTYAESTNYERMNQEWKR